MIRGFIAGNFDVIHPGYIKTFKECKENCDHFTILLHSDPTIERPNKLKPILSVDERIEVLSSIKYIDDIGLSVLNSFKGELLYNNLNVEGKFSGFARGLAYDRKYFYVGLSRNRNFSKLKSTSLNTSIDTGVVIFEPNNKISRFIQLSPKLSEIHSIHLI